MKIKTLLVLLTITTCTMNASDPKVVSGNGDLYLPPQDVAKCEKQASNGNSEAAFRLYLHYNLAVKDKAKAMVWLKVAAARGHVVAQYNLGINLIDTGDDGLRRDGIDWLTKAAAAGNKMAIDRLREVRSKGQAERVRL